MKKIFIVIFIIILIPSCQKKNGFVDENIPFVITVETPAKNPIDYMESLHVVSYMALETKSNNLLKNIKRVFVTDSSLVLFDDELHRIMLFSPKGDYLHDIGRRGAASDEYVGLNDVVYYNGNVYAHDRMRQRMLIYDLYGNLKQSHTSAFNFNSFCKTEAGYWIYSCFKKTIPMEVI